MIILWCHDLDHAFRHTRALTFQYALYIMRKQQLHFSNNFNSFLFSSRTELYRIFYRKFKKGNCIAKYVTERSLLTSRQNSE